MNEQKDYMNINSNFGSGLISLKLSIYQLVASFAKSTKTRNTCFKINRIKDMKIFL